MDLSFSNVLKSLSLGNSSGPCFLPPQAPAACFRPCNCLSSCARIFGSSALHEFFISTLKEHGFRRKRLPCESHSHTLQFRYLIWEEIPKKTTPQHERWDPVSAMTCCRIQSALKSIRQMIYSLLAFCFWFYHWLLPLPFLPPSPSRILRLLPLLMLNSKSFCVLVPYWIVSREEPSSLESNKIIVPLLKFPGVMPMDQHHPIVLAVASKSPFILGHEQTRVWILHAV